jgi:hypothetical protein
MVLARLKRQIEIGTEETRRRVRLIGSLSVSAGCRQIVRLDIAHLTAADLTRFVVRERQRRPLSPARVLVPALRSFLRFLYRWVRRAPRGGRLHAGTRETHGESCSTSRGFLRPA